MKKILVLVVGISMFQLAFGCGNEYGYSLSGKRIFTRYFYLTDGMKQFDTVFINEKLLKLKAESISHPEDYKVWSDISVNLMKLGQADSALQILLPLYQQHLNEYNIIANIGTSYELIGELDSALKYISLGYELNKDSHFGSEWVHIEILKAKLKEKKSPGWLKTHRILDVSELVVRVDANHSSNEVRKINDHISYQIRTRVPFTPAPNQVISNLLVSLGDFNFQVGTYENALLAYTYAIDFQIDGYIQRKIKTKIGRLNNSRINAQNMAELSPTFIRMMNRSRIDPEILLMGIDDYANHLDSIHMAEIIKIDSLKLLSREIDSLKGVQEKLHQQNNDAFKKIEIQSRYIWGLGVFAVIATILLLIKWFKK